MTRPHPGHRVNSHSDRGDLLDGVLPFVAGWAVVLPTVPGFLLCVPGLVLVGLVLIPAVLPALGVAVVVAGLPRSARRRDG